MLRDPNSDRFHCEGCSVELLGIDVARKPGETREQQGARVRALLAQLRHDRQCSAPQGLREGAFGSAGLEKEPA